MQRLAELTTTLRAERAARRGVVLPRAARRGRSRRPARLPARCGASGGERTRRRRPRDHAGAFVDRAVPHLLAPARPARAGVAGLGLARRARRRARQPTDRTRDPRVAPRAGGAARPCQLCRLRAGRHDGARTAARVGAARRRVVQGGAGAGARARAAGGRARCARRARCDRAVGLALLGRAGAAPALRARRGAAEAVLPAAEHGAGRVRLRRSACSGCASRRAPTSPPTTPTCVPTR